ncbi:MAG: GGDEF domain-containing protein [Gemmatimonadaceae bacterium]|jgi:diguanylate cyclase (GGDEF)-like protein
MTRAIWVSVGIMAGAVVVLLVTVGDRLLLAVAERLRRGVRLSDTVARFGGDEFVILFPALDPELPRAREVAEGLAQKLLAQLAEAHQLPGPDARGSAPSVVHRCPIALFDGMSDVAETLQAADRAMYRAKEHGRNRFALAER